MVPEPPWRKSIERNPWGFIYDFHKSNNDCVYCVACPPKFVERRREGDEMMASYENP